MAIIFPGVNPAVQTQGLKVPPRKIAANLLNPPTQRPTSIMCQFDWAGDYGVGVANPAANVLVNIDAGGAQNPIDIIRSVKIDNTGNPAPAYVYFLDSTDAIVAPANTIVWEPVVTNQRQANVILLGGTAAVGFTKVYFCNFFVPPYVNAEIAQAVELRLASPQIIFGGLSLLSGAVTQGQSGQSYVNGNLAVSGGGGGSLAAAHGILDAFGRFTGVVVDNAGAGYKSAITLTATAAHAARAAWLNTTSYGTGSIVTYLATEWLRGGGAILGLQAPWSSGTFYAIGNQVSVGNINYQSTVNQNQNKNPPTNPGSWTQLNTVLAPDSDSGWTNSGSPGGTNAAFSVTMATSGELLQNTTYAAPALGDQIGTYIDNAVPISSNTIFRHNLFGTQYPAGFIYLTAWDVTLESAAATGFQVWDIFANTGPGFSLATFESFYISTTAQGPISVGRMSGMNLKLDATIDWCLRGVSITSVANFHHAFVYTYSLK